MKQLNKHVLAVAGGIKYLACCCVIFIAYGVYADDVLSSSVLSIMIEIGVLLRQARGSVVWQ